MEPPGGEQIGPSNQHDVSAGCIKTIRAGLLLKRGRLLALPGSPHGGCAPDLLIYSGFFAAAKQNLFHRRPLES